MIFKIEEPNKPIKYIKKIDEANGKLTFTPNSSEAYYRSSGIIGNSVFQYIKFHFTEEYPEIKYLTKCG